MKNTNNVPRLRFPNFTDDWEQRELRTAATFSKGSGYSKNDLKENGTPIILYGRLYTKYETVISEVDTFVDVQPNSVYSTGHEVIVPASGETAEDISRASFVAKSGILLGGDLNIIVPDDYINPVFLALTISNGNQQKELSKRAQGKSVVHIHNSDLENVVLLYPKYEEQEKIGEYFSKLDSIITLHQRKCDKLEEYKKAMLQKIFSQELRFKREDGTEYPEWEEKKFGTTVLIERGGSPRPIKQYITNGDGYNWVKIGDAPEHGNYITHTEEKIKKSGLNKTRQVFKGDLILSNSMSFGKPYIMAIDGCIHDGWLLIRNNQNIYNLKFLCYLLGTDYMLKQYKSLAGGSTVNNLNKELVSMTTVSVPCLEEQQKIADFLSALDETISYAKQEFDKWKELKKGLLQQMFV